MKTISDILKVLIVLAGAGGVAPAIALGAVASENVSRKYKVKEVLAISFLIILFSSIVLGFISLGE